jgi:CPA2 family monovalent cation:H+ antiporter-2
MHLDEILLQAILVLAAAVAVVFVSARVRLPPIVGLILTGVVIGPSGFGVLENVRDVEALAEIGVVLLLFIIGLELSIGELKEMGRPFLLGGGVQALVTTGAAAAVAVALGVGWREAVFIGWVVVLSSTAVVLKLYGQRRETRTPQGRGVLGILLFQDLLIVPMIVLTPVLAGTEQTTALELALRFGGALAAVAAVIVAARFVMPWVLHQLVRTRIRELFLLASLLVCLGLSYFTYSLGFSLALGAFLAGLLISETDYSHQVIADVVPFRDLFASLFFISIGMLVDLPFVLARWPLLLGLAAGLVVLKASIAALAVRAGGYPARIAVIGGLGLAQIGEFSFVLMAVGRANGMLAGAAYQTLLVAAVLTLLVTPGLVAAAPSLGRRVAGWLSRQPSAAEAEEPALTGHVVIVGYGLAGSLLARVLTEVRVPFVVLELNAATVRQARRQGVPIEFGDASRREILEHAGIERAQAVVFAVSDPLAVRRGVQLARELAPTIEIIVRTRMVQEIETLREAGADDIVAEEFESAIEIFTLVLQRFHVPRNVIRAQTRLLRGEGYLMLRVPGAAHEASETMLEALAAGTTDLYRVLPTSRAHGATLASLDLRRRTGASVIALVRGETSHPNPSPTTHLEDGDTLVLVGSHGEIDAAFGYLDGGDGKE